MSNLPQILFWSTQKNVFPSISVFPLNLSLRKETLEEDVSETQGFTSDMSIGDKAMVEIVYPKGVKNIM